MKFAGMLAVFLISAISLCAQGSGADGSSAQNACPKSDGCPAVGNCPEASKCPLAKGGKVGKDKAKEPKVGKGKKSEPTKKAKGFVNRRTPGIAGVLKIRMRFCAVRIFYYLAG